MTDIKSMRRDDLRAALTERGYPAFRADQIRSWLDRGVTSFDSMTNLPAQLRTLLSTEFVIPSVSIERRRESVLMDYKHGWSQCLSTQVGCRMGCSFCATGMEGLARNLLPSEMMAQIEAAQADRGIRVSSIVLMGMGEPLDNYDNVLRFLEMLSEDGGVQIGQRHISLSTCGLVDKIRDLQQIDLQLTLSVSLHAPNDDIRRRLMPIARKWSIDQLLSACRDYTEATGRRISFEYAMFAGVNDSDACALELADRLHGMLCHVNLIPANAVEGTDHRRSERARLQAFADILSARGITTTIRRTLGADIEASCGQLRRKRDKQT